MKLLKQLPTLKLNHNKSIKTSNLFQKLYKQINDDIKIPSIELEPPLCFKKKDHILDKNGNTFWLLKKIHQEIPDYFDKETIGYLTNTNCLNDKECIEWLDTYGNDKLQRLYYLIYQNRISPHIINVIRLPNMFKSIYSSFVSLKIQQVIEKDYHNICIYQFHHPDNNRPISIKIILISSDSSSNYNYAKNLIRYILILLEYSKSSKAKKDIEVKIFMTDEKKEINPNYKCLGINEVNSGSTYRGDCSSILVWRKEEAFKVILHELCHCLSFDFELPHNILKKIINLFSIPDDTEIRPYEAYVETWGEIIYLSILAVDLKLDIEQILQKEINFSCYQVAKILKHFGFKSWEEFYKNTSRNSKDYCQKSSILSYYIIQASFMFSLESFLQWCSQHNGEQQSINYNNNNISIDESFYQLIEQCCDNQDFQQTINILMENKFTDDSSLRMTYHEIDFN